MIRQAGFACALFAALVRPLAAAELPERLLQESSKATSDPLGLNLVRLCRDQVSGSISPTLQQELLRVYSPRQLERLLAYGNVETRRAAVIGIGLIGDVQSQSPISIALRDSDSDVRRLAENSCRQIWARLATVDDRLKLEKIQEAARNQEFHSAAAQASLLIQNSPHYAEAWNERAILYYQMNRFTDSIQDCRQTLELNPYHFGAASGMAQCHLRMNQIPEAIAAFKLTAKLHPRLAGLDEQIAVLERIGNEK